VPTVQTEHGSPANLAVFAAEMFGRGRRAARYQPSGPHAPWSRDGLTGLAGAMRQRHAIAVRIGREILRIERRDVETRVAIGSFLYGMGTLAGLSARWPAGRYRDASLPPDCDPAAAIRVALRAVRRDPEDPALLLACADAFRRRKNPAAREKAERHVEAAARLSSFQEARIDRMADWLLARGLRDDAWMLGDTATVTLPSAVGIHERLAQAAHGEGDRCAFELAACDAIARGGGADWMLEDLMRQVGIA
jgi:hypothetical protein